MKWQLVLFLIVTGTLTTLGGIANLTGVETSYSGDTNITIGDNGYGYINFTSTYWAICFEHSEDKDAVYKKRTRSRTLWFNLDKISFTNPNIDYTFETATRGKDKWREVVDGDCIKRKTKSRPQTNRFRIVGHNIQEDTKWGFNAEYYLMEDISIDPVWKVKKDKFKKVEDCHDEFYEDIKYGYYFEDVYHSNNNSWGVLTHNNDTILNKSREVCELFGWTYDDKFYTSSDWYCCKKELICFNKKGSANNIKPDCIIQSGEAYVNLNDGTINLDGKRYRKDYEKVK